MLKELKELIDECNWPESVSSSGAMGAKAWPDNERLRHSKLENMSAILI